MMLRIRGIRIYSKFSTLPERTSRTTKRRLGCQGNRIDLGGKSQDLDALV